MSHIAAGERASTRVCVMFPNIASQLSQPVACGCVYGMAELRLRISKQSYYSFSVSQVM